MEHSTYPPSPALANDEFLKPSSSFKKTATRVVFAVIFFFLFYLVLVVIAGIVAAAAGFGGVAMIMAKPHWVTIAAGGGLVALGLMFFVFMFKFLFSSSKSDNPMRLQLVEHEQPQLFAFIRQLTKDTKTKFPKKIFISPDVNAMVFYNSNFWSLFFPVRKNLEIGLGLVNTLNVSEFKGVLAHEFGHFSQRSMKIGSYIYTVNRVIFNLVYEHDNWDQVLSSWAQTGGIFGFFAGLTFWLVERVRDLLKLAYNLINVNYMKLSREMEYHADLVAVSVSGNEAFVNALRKVEFSAVAYEVTTSQLNSQISKGKASENIFRNHGFIQQYLAQRNNLAIVDGHVHISKEDLKTGLIKSRINIEDQWASHPTLEQREDNINQVKVSCPPNRASAWTVFSNVEGLQHLMTKKLYENAPKSDYQYLSDEEFETVIAEESEKYSISEEYNGFYDDRYITEVPLEVNGSLGHASFEDIYSKDNIEKLKRLSTDKSDLEVLGQLSRKLIPTKYFEFDGKKYKRKTASVLIKQMTREVAFGEKTVEELDQQAVGFHLQKAKKAGAETELKGLYEEHYSIMKDVKVADEIYVRYENLSNRLFGQPRWTEEEIEMITKEFSIVETDLKNFLRIRDIARIAAEIEDSTAKEALEVYMKHDNSFFIQIGELHEEGLTNLSNLFGSVLGALGQLYSKSLKELTDFQLTIGTT